MKYRWQIICGIAAAFIMWGIITAADAFDEFVLDSGCYLGAVVFFAVPVVSFVLYLIHYHKKRPSAAALTVWHISYILAFLPLWYYIGDSVNYGRFFIDQRKRSDFMDLNGIEYIFYGFTALVLFTLLCIAAHIIRFIALKLNEHKRT